MGYPTLRVRFAVGLGQLEATESLEDRTANPRRSPDARRQRLVDGFQVLRVKPQDDPHGRSVLGHERSIASWISSRATEALDIQELWVC